MTCDVDRDLERSVLERVKTAARNGIADAGLEFDRLAAGEHVAAVLASGVLVWNREFPSILGAPLFYEMSKLRVQGMSWDAVAPRILGFGSYLADVACNRAGALPESLNRARNSTALLNMLIGFSDKLVDRQAGSRNDAGLVASILGRGAEEMFGDPSPVWRPESTLSVERSPALDFFLLTLDRFKVMLRTARTSATDSTRWAEFADHGDRLIRAEALVRRIPLAPGADTMTVSEALARKNSCACSLLVLNALFYAPGSPNVELVETAGTLGGLFGLVDDMADVVADARRSEWNECFVSLFSQGGGERCGECGAFACASALLGALDGSRVIEKLGADFGERLKSAAQAVEQRLGVPSGRDHILAWTDSWLRLY